MHSCDFCTHTHTHTHKKAGGGLFEQFYACLHNAAVCMDTNEHILQTDSNTLLHSLLPIKHLQLCCCANELQLLGHQTNFIAGQINRVELGASTCMTPVKNHLRAAKWHIYIPWLFVSVVGICCVRQVEACPGQLITAVKVVCDAN